MERADFGVLYGQKTTEDALLIYSSYEDSKSSPSVGDFIVLAPLDESGHKFLARVEAEVYRSEERRVGKECRSRWSPYH